MKGTTRYFVIIYFRHLTGKKTKMCNEKRMKIFSKEKDKIFRQKRTMKNIEI
jgi:hypothetical protein